MAKTLAEVGNSIRDQVKGFVLSDDERIDIELVYGIVFNLRSLLIKEEYKQKGYIDVNAFSSTCCLEIKCDFIKCNGFTSNIKEYYVEIPKLEGSLGYDAIRYFGGVDKISPYRKLSLEGFQFAKYEKYTGSSPKYTVVDNIAMVKDLPTQNAKAICIIGVFENGSDVCQEDDVFPCPGHLLHKLELLAIQQLKSNIGIFPDDKNDARDQSPQAQPTPIEKRG